MGTKMRLGARTFLSLVVFGLAAGTGSSGCTVVYHNDNYQCSTDLDCTSRGAGFAGTICSPDKGVCESTVNADCTSNEQCSAAGNGDPYICRTSDHHCIPVFSKECNTLIPHDAKIVKNNAVLFAFTGLKTGSEADAQKVSYNMIELGLNELNRSLGGLPGGPNGTARPIVGVECDESQVDGEPDKSRLLNSYNHIVNDLGIQAIVTNAYSSTTIDTVVPQYIVPKGIFLMPNQSLSPLITTLDDQGLVWRSISPTTTQASAQAAAVSLVETKIRASTNPPMTDPIRVALITSTGVVFSATGDAVQAELRFNNNKTAVENGANFQKFSHTSSNDNPSVDLSDIANRVLNFHPHVIVATNKGNDLWEAVEKSPKGIAPAIERQWVSTWGASSYKPVYVISSPTFERAMAYLTAPATEPYREDIRKRIVVIDYAPANTNLYANFLLNYQAEYTNQKEDPVLSGLNNYAVYYDGIYSMIYAMFAAAQKNATAPLTGKAIAESMSRLVTGDPFNVGPTDIVQVKQRLAAGQSVNLQGVYSALDYDLNTGDSPTEAGVVCIENVGGTPSNPTGFVSKFSGQRWDRGSRQWVGDKASCLTPPKTP